MLKRVPRGSPRAACSADLAGRALGAEWDVAERAAFALLEAARVADTAADRRGVIAAMGRGFRNIWLLPFVHRRLSDRDETIAAAALDAAGGLGFPALEEAVAAFVAEGVPPALRRAAIGALGRMGAASAVDRLVAVALGDPAEAPAALAALTEIRSPAARAAVLGLLDGELEPEVQIAAVRYLAELGALEVLPTLRRLARADSAEIRIAASLASRALKAERARDAGERFLIALSEPDRAVRAQLARRLRTLPVADVIEQADVLLGDDAGGVVQLLGEVREPEITKYLLALAARADLPVVVRARAIGAIEADQAWEREALAALAHDATADETIRASRDPGDGRVRDDPRAGRARRRTCRGDVIGDPRRACCGRCSSRGAATATRRRSPSSSSPCSAMPIPTCGDAPATRPATSGSSRSHPRSRSCARSPSRASFGSRATSRSASSACRQAWSPSSSRRSAVKTIRACSALRRTR